MQKNRLLGVTVVNSKVTIEFIFNGACECPDIFFGDGWWYLIYSNYTDKLATFYVKSKSLNGPWCIPENNIFDGRAFY